MDSEKSINSFIIERDKAPDYLWDNFFFFWKFVNNFSALLLCEIFYFFIWLIFSDFQFHYLTSHELPSNQRLATGTTALRENSYIFACKSNEFKPRIQSCLHSTNVKRDQFGFHKVNARYYPYVNEGISLHSKQNVRFNKYFKHFLIG